MPIPWYDGEKRRTVSEGCDDRGKECGDTRQGAVETKVDHSSSIDMPVS